jgi:hypothetical protein
VKSIPFFGHFVDHRLKVFEKGFLAIHPRGLEDGDVLREERDSLINNFPAGKWR